MALRRPPTRIELKTDDIEDYEEILRERQMAAEEAASNSGSYKGKGMVGGPTPSPGAKRKQAAAERIGIGKAR
eukprot:CAMPEP_0183322366 /NCGR_PEP_ID=MMETSP0160_2-20130417/71438_1 /TAXON_ID=2839 ORGANISM="Odontella Sinensis, Strain Grunow 1884" /NCGR_SAMPLE_ID=MMETSP0160_2 /ASSEMBLY_ACC=CAM_ASM_000250 /LENGTH=72 /DNA_ID=CAMNT_0025489515 /DNA_START=36 /DNA_END=254 /DNA_ORIENTATION=-